VPDEKSLSAFAGRDFCFGEGWKEGYNVGRIPNPSDVLRVRFGWIAYPGTPFRGISWLA